MFDLDISDKWYHELKHFSMLIAWSFTREIKPWKNISKVTLRNRKWSGKQICWHYEACLTQVELPLIIIVHAFPVVIADNVNHDAS